MKTPAQLKKSYEKICTELIQSFCIKQGIEFNTWIADRIGEVAEFEGEYYFTIQDILFDITTNQPPKQIFDWYLYNLSYPIHPGEKPQWVNYQSFANGFRFENIPNTLNPTP